MCHVTSIEEETLSIHTELGDSNKGQRVVQSSRLATGEPFLLGLKGQGKRAGVRTQEKICMDGTNSPGAKAG